jgi:predicted esterase
MADAHSTTLPTFTSPSPTPLPIATLDVAASTPCSIPAQETTISQIKKGEIAIDGDLADWAAREWLAVCSYYSGRLQAPSPDLDVSVSFAFDTEKFYLAVKALDDEVQKVDRSWRYGDGFLFTLVTDEGKDRSSYGRQFGFDQESKFLVFGNGEYFPPFDTQDVEFKFRQHSRGVDYEIAIPLALLEPFSPFIYEKVALNLVYTDRDGAGGTTVMLHPDADFDTERSRMRAGEFFTLQTADPETTQGASYHAALGKNFFRDGETIGLRYAVNADKSQDRTGISAALLRDGAAIQQAEETVDLHPGLNRGTLPLSIGDLATGDYTLQVAFQDTNGNTVSEYADDVFVMNQGEIEEAKEAISAYEGQEAIEASLPNLEIRFDWLDEFYKRPNYEDISALNAWWGDIVTLSSALAKGEPAVFGTNIIKRYAHRSNIDNTLQPYSVYLPESFNAGTEYPLIVALHGSGVDEQEFIKGMVGGASILGYPVIAPKARGLSSYYVGDSGEDVFESIEHFISLFPNIRRDRIFLMGFSMGGYGAWHLGILRPDTFRGLIILSGAVRPDLLGQIDKLRDANIFVVHGAKDNAVPVDGARRLVEKLKAMNANVVYIEIPEGGHGNYGDYDPGTEILAWIEKYASSSPTDTTAASTTEPTARPTAPTATPNPDWVEYRNELFGYRLSLPAQASVEELGPEYFPAGELPPGATADAYLEHLRERYRGLCVRVEYGLGYVYVSAPLNSEARYSPCGRTGVGEVDIVTRTLTLPIDGALYETTEMEFISPPGETLADHSDYVLVRLDDSSRIEIGSVPGAASWQEYVASTRDVLLQIASSYQSLLTSPP